MLRKPPSFVVTTPESLYLLVTSEQGSGAPAHGGDGHRRRDPRRRARQARRAPRARPSSGSRRCATRRPHRIGLSATQRPIETVGRLLVGDRPLPAIVDAGHQRDLDLALELPEGELEAVTSARADERRARPHRRAGRASTAPRSCSSTPAGWPSGSRTSSASAWATTSSPPTTAACRRSAGYRVETRLRAGDLRALVATASLELGIDIGPVELVCQIGSPRSIATFLQRVGRSNHSRAGTPKGRLYPLTRDELVECTALLAAVRAGRLDAIQLPALPLDIAAQQIVAEVRRAGVAAPTTCSRSCAAPRRTPSMTREQFDEVVDLVSNGIATGRGRTGRVRAPRRGQRRAARSQGRAPRRGHLGRRDPRDRRLPRRGRARRHLHRHRQRGLGGRVDGGRHLPARHPLVADPQGRARRGAGARRRRRAADRAVLDGRGAGAHRRAVAGGVASCAPRSTRSSPRAIPTARAQWLVETRRHRTRAGHDGRRLPGGRRGRCSARCPRRSSSCSSASSTRPAACSSSCTRRTAGGSTARSGWRCARSSAAPSTSSCRRRRATTPSCCRSVRTTASRLSEVPGYLSSRDRRRHARARHPRLPDVPGPLALEPQPVPDGAALPQRPAQPAADPAHGVRRPHGRGVPAGGGVPGERHRPDRDPRPRARAPDHQRHAARGARRRRRARPAAAHGGGRGHRALRRHHRAVGAGPRDHHRAALRVPRRRGAAEPAHQRGHAAARVWRSTSRPSGRSTPRPSSRCTARSRPSPTRPTTCTTCCRRWWCAARGPSGSELFDELAARGRASVLRPPRHGPLVHHGTARRRRPRVRRRRRCCGRDRCAVTSRSAASPPSPSWRRRHHAHRRARAGRAGLPRAERLRAAGALHATRRVDTEWVSRRLLARMHSYSRRTRRGGVEPATAQDFMRFLLRWQHVAPGTQLAGEAGLAHGGRATAGLRGRRGGVGTRPARRRGCAATTPRGSTGCATTARWRGCG